MVFSYLKVLRKRNFLLLWIGQLVSQFGDRLTQIALVGLVSKVSTSSWRLALIFSMTIFPVILFSPVCGVYIDRWDNRKTMYISDIFRGIFILAIPLFFIKLKFFPVIYLLVFLSFTAGRFFIPAKMAFIPQIVKEEDIFLANSLVSTTATVAAILGIGVGGVIVEKWGVVNAFVIDGITFFISALAIIFTHQKGKGKFLVGDFLDIGKEVVEKVKGSFLKELKEGIKYMFSSQETKYAFKIFFFLFAYLGALSVVFMRFIQNTLGSLTEDLGFIGVSLGAGVLLGSLIYGRVAHRFSVKIMINIILLLSSIYLLFFTLSIKIYPYSLYAIILSAILGFIISPIFIGINGLIHRESEHKLLGRIFSGLEFISHLGFIIAMFVSSILADVFSPFTIVISTGIMGFLFSGLFFFSDDNRRRTQTSST